MYSAEICNKNLTFRANSRGAYIRPKLKVIGHFVWQPCNTYLLLSFFSRSSSLILLLSFFFSHSSLILLLSFFSHSSLILLSFFFSHSSLILLLSFFFSHSSSLILLLSFFSHSSLILLLSFFFSHGCFLGPSTVEMDGVRVDIQWNNHKPKWCVSYSFLSLFMPKQH